MPPGPQARADLRAAARCVPVERRGYPTGSRFALRWPTYAVVVEGS